MLSIWNAIQERRGHKKDEHAVPIKVKICRLDDGRRLIGAEIAAHRVRQVLHPGASGASAVMARLLKGLPVRREETREAESETAALEKERAPGLGETRAPGS